MLLPCPHHLMATAHRNTPPAKRIKVQSDINPQPQWLLIPPASRTVQDLVKSLLVRLELPDSFSYDLYLDGAPILPNEDVALVRDGEQLHLRQRQAPSPLPPLPNPLHEPQRLSMSSAPGDIRCETHRKRKRILTPEGKRRRNVRNRKREKRRRLERRESPNKHDPSISNSQHDDPKSHGKLMDSHSPRSNTGTDEVKPLAMQECEAAMQDESSLSATRKASDEQEKPGDTTRPSNKDAKIPAVSTDEKVAQANVVSQERSMSLVRHANEHHQQNLDSEVVTACIARNTLSPHTTSNPTLPDSSSRNDPQGVSANATAPSHTTNPCLSYVDCEKALVHPSALPVSFKRTEPERNDRESSQPPGDQDGYVPVPAADKTSRPRPPTDGEPSKLKSNQQMTKSESHGEADVLIRTANKKAALRDENVLPQNDEHNLDAISSAAGVQPEVNNSECTRDEEVTINISFVNQVANEDRLIANPAVAVKNHCVQHGHALSDNGQKQIQPLNEIVRASVCQKNRQDALKSVQPRWKRQRLQGNDSIQEQPDPPSISLADTKNMEHIHRAGTSVTNDAPDRLETQGNPDHGTDVWMSQVERAETTTPPIDVINLVEGEEDRARAFDHLRGSHQSLSTNSSKSNSPQSIVVSPAEPREAILATAEMCAEVSRKRLTAGNNETDSIQQIQGTVTEKTTPVNTSRRKSTNPRRLSKPNADVDLSNVAATARANSQEELGSTEELPESLRSLEHVVVTDGRQDAVKECKERQAVIAREGQQNTRISPAERPSAQGTQESVEKAAEGDTSKLTPKDKKKKQSCLKGGMSTLDALRVARAHQARLLTAEKQKKDADIQNNTEAMATENMDNTQEVKTDFNARREGGKARKKSKRRKRSKCSMRYLNEEQMNRSTLVSHRPETMLPPLELLGLPDDADELRQVVDVPETTLIETRKRFPPETTSDGQKDAEVTSEPHDKTEGTPFLATAATKPVLLSDSRSESARHGIEEPAGEPNSCLGNRSGVRNNQSEERAYDQQRNGMHREIVAQNPSQSQRTTAANNVLPQFGNGDNFREDLFQILRHTSKTLAEVWVKWDDCQ